MFWLKGCRTCGGDLYQAEDIYGLYIACLQCSRELSHAEARALLGFRPVEEDEGIVIRLVPGELETVAA